MYVVAGGYDGTSRLSSAAVLDLNNYSNTWSAVASLPESKYGAASVPFGDTFLIVGGSDGTSDYKTILEFDPVDMDWISRTEVLQDARNGAFAVTTSADYIACT